MMQDEAQPSERKPGMTDHPQDVRFRDAARADVPAIVRLLAADALGMTRERCGGALDPAYLEAFDAIDRDPNNRLVVADLDGRVVGCMQLTTIPHLTFQGGTRLQIEGVRVDPAFRSRNIGSAMFRWAIEQGRARGCHVVQLTTNKCRDQAQNFYRNLGFEPSHVGYKLYLR